MAKLFQSIQTGWQAARLTRGLLAVRRADDPHKQQRARAHVCELMATMRGLPAKIGQWLSEDDDDPLALLENSIPPLTLEDIAEHLQQSWPGYDTYISEIAESGHAASLGQVHEARSTDGKQLAIKIQYPNIADQCQRELALLRYIPQAGPIASSKLDIDAHHQYLCQRLAEECDYKQEVSYQRQFFENNTSNHILIPEPYNWDTGSQVLVQSWHDGHAFREAGHLQDDLRRLLAEGLVRFWLHHFFFTGLIHSDLHPGNLKWDISNGTPRLIIYDYGSCWKVPAEVQTALYYCINDSRQKYFERTFAAFTQLGFAADSLMHFHQRLPAICATVFQPFLSEWPSTLQEWSPNAVLQDILGEHRWFFRAAGRPHLFPLIRSYAGLMKCIRLLNCPVAFGKIWQQTVENYRPGPLIEPPQSPPPTCMAEHFCIQVTRDGKQVVDLKMPASAVNELEQLMSEEMHCYCRQHNIDTQALLKQVRQAGYEPQTILDCEMDDRQVRLWLSA